LLAREKPITDGALPSGNSVAAANLSRLAALTGDESFSDRQALLFSAFAVLLETSPWSASELMKVVSDRDAGLREVVLVEGGGEANLESMLGPLRTTFTSNRVLILKRDGPRGEAVAAKLSLARSKNAIGGKTTAYVCENRVCQFPTTDPAKFLSQLTTLEAGSDPL
jgi:uncharacterized protein YyaL (SSP411 family)